MRAADVREGEDARFLGDVAAREHGVQWRPCLVDVVLRGGGPEGGEFAVEGREVGEAEGGGGGDGRVDGEVGRGEGMCEGVVEAGEEGRREGGEEGGPGGGGEGVGGEERERGVEGPAAGRGREEGRDGGGRGVGAEEGGDCSGEGVGSGADGRGVRGDDADGAGVGGEAEGVEGGGGRVGRVGGISGVRERGRQSEGRVAVVVAHPGQRRDPAAAPPAGLRHGCFRGLDECARNDQRYDTRVFRQGHGSSLNRMERLKGLRGLVQRLGGGDGAEVSAMWVVSD